MTTAYWQTHPGHCQRSATDRCSRRYSWESELGDHHRPQEASSSAAAHDLGGNRSNEAETEAMVTPNPRLSPSPTPILRMARGCPSRPSTLNFMVDHTTRGLVPCQRSLSSITQYHSASKTINMAQTTGASTAIFVVDYTTQGPRLMSGEYEEDNQCLVEALLQPRVGAVVSSSTTSLGRATSPSRRRCHRSPRATLVMISFRISRAAVLSYQQLQAMMSGAQTPTTRV
jgi:hypothetical protein